MREAAERTLLTKRASRPASKSEARTLNPTQKYLTDITLSSNVKLLGIHKTNFVNFFILSKGLNFEYTLISVLLLCMNFVESRSALKMKGGKDQKQVG